MNDLLYNAEGYKDEKAYKAILQAERGSENMSGYEINKGEIWEVEGNGYGTKLVVVLCCYEKYAATVMLQDQEPGSNAVPVKARDIMYADAGRLGWTFYDKMVDFVRALSEDESYELRRRIAEALELPDDEAPLDSMAADANREIDGLQYEIAQLRQQLKEKTAEAEEAYEHMEANAARVDELEEQIKKTKDNSLDYKLAERRLHEDLAAASKEAEIYKGLYEQLLARALG